MLQLPLMNDFCATKCVSALPVCWGQELWRPVFFLLYPFANELHIAISDKL